MKKKKKLAKLVAGKKRDEMMEAGAYDGRFKPRTVKSKKAYSRKNKRNLGEE